MEKKKKKIKLSKKDIAIIQKQLGYHNSGVEYKITLHNRDIHEVPGV